MNKNDLIKDFNKKYYHFKMWIISSDYPNCCCLFHNPYNKADKADKTIPDRKLWNWKKTKYSWKINSRKNMMNAILEASKIAAKWEIDSL